MSAFYVVTYEGSEFIANAVAGSGKLPNCMYAVYSNEASPGAITLSPNITQSWFENDLPSTCGYLVARNRAASRVVPHTDQSPVKAIFSSLISKDDVKTTSPVFGAGSKIVCVALAHGEETNGVWNDTIIAVAVVTVGGVFTPITYVANTSMSVSMPLNFEAAEDYSEESSSSVSSSESL